MPRFVSLILITVIIACPMWCGTGLLCHAGPPRVAHECEAAATDDHACGPFKSCCDESEPTGDENVPCPDQSCQGVCGGAVLQKFSELSKPQAAEWLSTADAEPSATAQRAGNRMIGCANRYWDTGSTEGHSLRALHMSWLC